MVRNIITNHVRLVTILVAVAPNEFAFVADSDSNAINLATTTKCIRIQIYAMTDIVTIFLHCFFVKH